MKKFLQDFFKSKLNIVLFVLQTIAIIFVCVASIWNLAVLFVLIFEGAFFIVFGIKNLQKNKKLDEELELLGKISIENIDMQREGKRNKLIKKSNVFTSIIYFLMGIMLIIVAII